MLVNSDTIIAILTEIIMTKGIITQIMVIEEYLNDNNK